MPLNTTKKIFSVLKKVTGQADIMVFICNPNILKTKARGLPGVLGQPRTRPATR